MKAKRETTDRFPTWWLFYYVLRKAYFFLGIPFFSVLRIRLYRNAMF